MKKLKIAVFTENINYARALAKGLCCQSSGVEVLVTLSEAEAEKAIESGSVLITDRDMAWKGQILLLSEEKPKEGEEERRDGKISAKSPVKAILDAALDVVFENTGEVFHTSPEEKVQVWESYSLQGGSGVTSITITLAGFLAGRVGKQVLYMNLSGWDDYEVYVDAEFEKTFPKAQFICGVEMSFPMKMEGYFAQDNRGVCYFKPQRAENSFLEEADLKKIICALAESGKFCHIVLDSGKNAEGRIPEADLRIQIADCRSSRPLPKSKYGEMAVANFSSREGVEEGIFHIPWDKESFVAEQGKINISSYGDFAEQVEALLAECLSK